MNFYFNIEALKKRVDKINQLRLRRAVDSVNKNFIKVYSLLPILFHYHHQMIPGFVEGNVPHGICFFSPDIGQLRWLSKLDCFLPFRSITSYTMPIAAIYSMGSTSSLGQNQSSDIDIWVCCSTFLSNEEKVILKKKCILIEQWAASMFVKTTIFLIDENSFRCYKNDFSKENYGLVQRVFLLDEFYRTSVRIAGKRLLWNMVPVEEEPYYDEYVIMLYNKRILNPNEWLDFGGLYYLSYFNFFSHNLHQLNKSNDCKYKIILKKILFESYLRYYKKNNLLAIEFKKYLHTGKIICYGLDSYCLMLDRVTRYLYETNELTRLEFIRRCFYLKVSKMFYKNIKNVQFSSWRKIALTQLIDSWGWSRNF
ncbi:Adenylate cyclase [Candidatus Providencia siddallii]|uniref:Adenylate cyclase, partial n=1 Tax=Candidatus Providencia siddallii TaxID=1715285 RepID=A0A0M6W7C9_9GAMM|nr:Adenylate cyclase [Candidatus Providencia siddallii]